MIVNGFIEPITKEHGVVTDKERSMLARLATELGVTPMEAFEIERSTRGPP